MESTTMVTTETRREFAAGEGVFARAARLASGDGVFAKAAALAAGDGVMSRAVAVLNEGGGEAFSEAVRIMNATSDGTRPLPIEGGASHGAPTRTPKLELDPAAMEVARRAAAAAKKVHGLD